MLNSHDTPRASDEKGNMRSTQAKYGAAERDRCGRAGIPWLVLVAVTTLGATTWGSDRSTDVPPNLQRIFAGAPPRNADDLKAMQRRIRLVTQKILPCTVGVDVGSAHGSGVIVSQDGYVLTAAHVAGQPGRDAQFALADGRRVHGKSLGTNVQLDAGLMKITDEGKWPFVPLGDSAKIRVGSWCLATGHPGGYEGGRQPVLRIGRVTAKWKSSIRTDCTLVSGDSGGPLFDMSGRVIGIHSRVGIRVATNLHVPVSVFRRDWQRLVAGHRWGAISHPGPVIGVVQDRSAPGATILKARPGSPAAEAGLQPGDVIVEFDGQAVGTFGRLADLVRVHQPGESVPIRIQRGNESIRLNLRIGGSDK